MAVYVDVFPNMARFTKDMVSGTRKAAEEAARAANVEISAEVSPRSVAAMKRELRKLTTGRAAAISIDPHVNTAEVDAQMRMLRAKIERSQAGRIGLTPEITPRASARLATEAGKAGKEVGTRMGRAVKSALSFAGIGAALYGGEVLKEAGDFQQAMILLNTAGGEARKNLPMISKGVQNIAKETGTSLDQVSAGMYTIEKAGIRGAGGLKVLKAAAEGARGEGADLGTMTNALTSIMASYGSKMRDPVKATNELVAAAGASKTRMQDFAGALSTVQPIAARAGIDFSELGGAIGTLTSHGTSADEATQELANTIRNLQAPNRVAVNEMAQLGISSNTVAKQLGDPHYGLQAVIDELSRAVLQRMGPAGTVLLKTFNQSKVAARDASSMYAALAKNADAVYSSVGKGKVNTGTANDPVAMSMSRFLEQLKAGKVSTTEYRNALKSLTPTVAAQVQQFQTVQNKAKGFNSELRAGGQPAQTYNAAMKAMMGGATGLNTALQLTGESSAQFTTNSRKIARAGEEGGKTVTAWKEDQQSFNVQLSKFSETIKVTAVQIATRLLPPLITTVKWIGENKKTVLEIVAAYVAWRLATKAFNVVQGVMLARQVIAKAATEGTAAAQLAAAEATKGLTVTQWALNVAMDNFPVIAIVAGLIALGVALVVAYKKSSTFRAIVQGALHGVEIAFHAVVAAGKAALSGLITAWDATANFFTKTIPHAFDTTVNFLKGHWKTFAEIGLLLAGALFGPIGLLVGGLAALIMKYWKPIVGAFKAGYDAIVSAGKAAWNAVVGPATAALKVLRLIGVIIYAVVALPFVLAFDAIRIAAKKLWEWIGPYVMAAIRGVAKGMKATMNALLAAWRAAWGAVSSAAKFVWHGIVAFFTGAFNLFKKLVMMYFHLYVTVITAIWRTLRAPLEAVWNAIAGFFTAVWKRFKTNGQRDWHAIVSAITAVWNTLAGPLKSAWRGIESFFTSVWNGFKKTTKKIWDDIAAAIPAAIRGIGKGLSSALDALKNTFIGPFKWIVNNVINKFIGLLDKVPGVSKFLHPISWDGKSNSNANPGNVAKPVNNNIGANTHQHRAKGGPVRPGTRSWVGEEGPEIMEALPGGGVMIYPHKKSVAMASPRMGYAGGGIFGAVGHFVKSAVNKGANWAIDAARGGANALVSGVPGPSIMKAIGHGVVNTVAKAAKALVGKALGTGGPGGARGDMSAHSASAAAAQAYARSIIGQFGWGSGEMGSLISLWNGESGWNNMAQNPTSTAFGIAQFLNGTWAGKKYPKTTNYRQQVYDGLQYIQGSYGSPSAALSAWLSRSPHWYAKGTKGALPGWAVVGERGPELVKMRGGETVLPHNQTKQALHGYAKGTPDAKSLRSSLVKLTAGVKAFAHDFVSTINALGPMSTAVQIHDATHNLQGMIPAGLSAPTKNRLVAYVKAVNTQLTTLANERDQITARLSSARGLASDTASSARDSALAGSAAMTPGFVARNLTMKFTAIKKFDSQLKQLARKGYSRSVLSQILAMGVTDGSNLATVLLHADRGMVKQISGDLNAVNYWSGVLGTEGAGVALGGSAGYIGQLQRQQASTEQGLQRAEDHSVNVFPNSTVIVQNDAQAQALTKKLAFAVSHHK